MEPPARSPPPGFASLRVDPGGGEYPHATPKPLENPKYDEPPGWLASGASPLSSRPPPGFASLRANPGAGGDPTGDTKLCELASLGGSSQIWGAGGDQTLNPKLFVFASVEGELTRSQCTCEP